MKTWTKMVITALGIILVLGLAYSLYYGYGLAQELALTKQQFASSTAMFQEKVANLEGQLAEAQNENSDLREDLREEKGRNDEFADQIDEIADTVGVLEKLSKTDKELLQKYSKVYFLNEHYVPERLTDIDQQYALPPDRELQIHIKVWPFLEDLLTAAQDDKIALKIISAYRSFGTQADLKSGYRVTYGAGTANQFSADQGYSEHQLGTAVDFTTAEVGATFSGFDKTDAYKWLQNNAHKYGFVLSYPSGNAYYVFEPWHWRFVGDKLARDLHRDNNYFYNLDQRDIDKYLVSIFD